MAQCPNCHSYNDSGSVFCGQCGQSLRASPVGRSFVANASPSDPRRTWRRVVTSLLGIVLLAGGVVAVWLLPPEKHETGGGDESVVALQLEGPAVDSPGVVMEQVELPEAAEELDAIPFHKLRPMVQRAMCELTYFDSDGDEISVAGGVRLLPAGLVLTRFKPLLGAFSGQAAVWEDPVARRVRGVVQIDPRRNLALLAFEPPPIPATSELPALEPLIGELAEESLVAGLELWVFAFPSFQGRDWVRTVAEDYPYYLPDRIERVRLAEGANLPGSGPLVAVDPFGFVAGLAKVDRSELPGGSAVCLVDPIGELAYSLDQPVRMTLQQLTGRFYEGTFADLIRRGRKARERGRDREACDLLFQAVEQGRAAGVDGAELEEASRALRAAVGATLAAVVGENDWASAVALLERSVGVFPEERDLWADLGRAYSKREAYREAISAFRSAVELGTSPELEAMLQNSYIRLASQFRTLGDSNASAQVLLEGIETLPRSAPMHLELAKIYQSWEYFEDAVRLFRIAEQLDPSLAAEVELYLEKIEAAIRRGEAVVIPFASGSTSIRTQVVLDGAAAHDFIVDTGASMTAVSRAMADDLGYRIGPATPRMTVRTADNVLQLPVITLRSLSVQGFTVRDLQVLVLNDRSRDFGLLGLNYLNHFKLTVDSAQRELRLERR